jgi:hypothetical protein
LKDKSPFFAYHDLAHYAVETTLGPGQAFLGLVASGWDLGDFGSPEDTATVNARLPPVLLREQPPRAAPSG